MHNLQYNLIAVTQKKEFWSIPKLSSFTMAWTSIYAYLTTLFVWVAGTQLVDDNAKVLQTEGDDRLDTEGGFLALATDAAKGDNEDNAT